MRADLALILFVLTLAGGIALLVLRKKRGGAPLLIGGWDRPARLRGSAGAVSGGSGAAGAGRALKTKKYHRISQIFKNCPLRFLIPS